MGVLIDDLVTKGTNEPYRMFTSRAEHRLVLDVFSADERLSKLGYELGLVNDETYQAVVDKYEAIARDQERLKQYAIKPSKINQERFSAQGIAIKQQVSAHDLLRRPGVTLERVMSCADDLVIESEDTWLLANKIRYAPYVEREREELAKMESLRNLRIPKGFEFTNVPGLKLELVEKLSNIRPETLDQASRISGMNAATLAILHVFIKRFEQEGKKTA